MKDENNKITSSIINQKDLLILQKLIEDGRQSSASISKEIDLGREIVNYRIKRLIKENLIVKFVPKINKKKIGYKEYLILLKLNLEDEISKNKFIYENIGNKYLIWTVKSNSGWDLIVRLYAENVEEFKEKLQEILENFQNTIAKYYTIMSIDEICEREKEILCQNLFNNDFIKQTDFKEIKKSKKLIQFDKKDKQIINLLEGDGRVQYSEIANKLSMSSDTVKYRIEKMKKQGIIENFKPVINFSKLGVFQYVVIVKFNYLQGDKEIIFENFLKEKDYIIKAIKNVGSDEFFITLVFREKLEIDVFNSEIKDMFKTEIDTYDHFLID